MTPTGEADPLVAEDVEEAEAKDLRNNQESSFATSTAPSQITPQTTVQTRRKPSKEWKQKRWPNWSVIQAALDQQTKPTTSHN